MHMAHGYINHITQQTDHFTRTPTSAHLLRSVKMLCVTILTESSLAQFSFWLGFCKKRLITVQIGVGMQCRLRVHLNGE